MAQVSVVPIVLALVGGVLLFAAWLPFAIRESRRPLRWHDTPGNDFTRSPVADLPVAAPRLTVLPGVDTEEPTRIGHARIAIVVAAFALWALVATRSTHRRV